MRLKSFVQQSGHSCHGRYDPFDRRSGTRREELLLAEDDLQRMWILRKLLATMEDVPATEFILDKLIDTKTNDEFFLSMKRK